jgi:hypothetical protein
MSTFFLAIMIIAMLSALGALVIGLVSMVKGGDFDKKYSNKLMQARVMLQGLALACLALLFLTSKHS